MRLKLALAACLFASNAWAADPPSQSTYSVRTGQGNVAGVVQMGLDITGLIGVPCGSAAVFSGCGLIAGAAPAPGPLSDTTNGDLHATNLSAAANTSWLGQIYTWLSGSAAKDGTDGASITPPTGAVGIRGWLSGSYSVLGQTYAWLTGSAATSVLQATGNSSLATIVTNTGAGATAIGQTAANGALVTIVTNTATNATATGQSTGNASLATIATNTGAGATAANQSTAQSTLGSMLTALGNIYTKLTGSLAVTGTFWQATQPVSGAFYQASQPVADPANATYAGVIAITPGTPVAAQREVAYLCTASGTVTLTYADASTQTVTLPAATYPFGEIIGAVTNVALGTASGCSFWNRK